MRYLNTSRLLPFFLVCLFTACGQGKKGDKLISVTIEPQRYFAERIAGDKFSINCVVPVGQSPESYDPTPREMVRIGESIAYLRIGTIGFELAWMDNIADNNPHLQIFDLSEGVHLLESHEHEEEGHHHHHHGDTDPHIWSSISGAKAIISNILNALTTLDPDNTAYFQANYKALLQEIEETEQQVSALLDPLRGKAFIIYHPALTYLAHEYGLEQLCIEMDGKEPSPAQLQSLVEMAKEHDAKVVFVQKEFDQKNAEQIAKDTGCHLIAINPLEYHWSEEMVRIAKALSDGEAD